MSNHLDDNRSSGAAPILYAHRGAAIEQPENTIPSFRRGLALGATALETDVHMTSDGHVVISHDPSTLRMTGVDLALRRTRLADLRELDAGYGFVDPSGERPFAGKGYRIPTLEEVLVGFPGVQVNIDIKQPWPPMVRQIVRLVRRLGATERVTLASFHLRTVAAVRALGYDGATGLSQPEVAALIFAPGRLLRALRLCGARAQVPTRTRSIELASPRFIDKCHDLGIAVDFWTINDPAEARRLLDLGADGIMTDDPESIAPVLAAHAAAGAGSADHDGKGGEGGASS